MVYIQFKSSYGLETVDQAETRKEARELLKEYQASDTTGRYYLSSRACRHWHG